MGPAQHSSAAPFFSHKGRQQPTRNEERAIIHKLILTAVLATGAIASVAPTVSAAPPVTFDRHDHDHDRNRGRFQVLVRHHGHWDVHGTYRDRDDARRLERQGLDTRIERVRGR